MINDAVIISDIYIDNDNTYKQGILDSWLSQIKKIDLPIFLISNSGLNKETQNQIDHYIYNKENLFYSKENTPKDHIYFWFGNDNLRFETFKKTYQPHGLSVLNNLNIAVSYLKQKGYKYFIHIEWDLVAIDETINYFKSLIKDCEDLGQKAVFVRTEREGGGLSDLDFTFWMCELDFWQDNFPQFNGESELVDFIKSKANVKSLQAEKILHLAFENVFDECCLVPYSEFITATEGSNINAVINPLNFEYDDAKQASLGLSRYRINGMISKNSAALMTWNMSGEIIEKTEYTIKSKKSENNFIHEGVYPFCYKYDVFDLSYEDFPIELVINNKYKMIYKNFSDFHSDICIED